MKISRLLLIFSIFSFSILLAQDVDLPDFMQEDTQDEEVNCKPESLDVIYDSYADSSLDKMQVNQWYSFGSEYHKNKNWKAALPYLWKVFVNNKGKRGELAIGKVAECYFNLQQVDSMFIAVYKGLAVFPENQKLHYYGGFVHENLGRTACAVPHYEILVEQNPENKNYLTILAQLYFKQNDDRCMEIQKRVTDLDPNDQKAAEVLGLYYEKFGVSAITIYETQYGNDPENIDIARKYAQVAVNEGQYIKALDPLNKIISKSATADDYKLRSLALENLSRFNEAINDLNQILKLTPDNVDVMLQIAFNYRSLKQFASANNWINNAIRINPNYGASYIAKGELYEDMVNYCQNQRKGDIKLEDKIVYQQAYKQYQKALVDPIERSTANNRMKNLKPYLPLQEEIFMDAKATIKSDCYLFLQGTIIDPNLIG